MSRNAGTWGKNFEDEPDPFENEIKRTQEERDRKAKVRTDLAVHLLTLKLNLKYLEQDIVNGSLLTQETIDYINEKVNKAQ